MSPNKPNTEAPAVVSRTPLRYAVLLLLSPLVALADEGVAARIQPVGQLRLAPALNSTAAESQTEVENAATAAAQDRTAEETPLAATTQDGAKLVQRACLSCHSSGLLNAPKLGDEAAWQARIAEKGEQQLLHNAIHGIGLMPARGGSALSDTEMAAAVRHLMGQ